MKLATTVVVPVLRGPVPTAKILGAIDILSSGRLTVAVGPGSSPRDYALIGIPFEERWKRLDESIKTMRAVWSGGEPGFDGTYYTTSFESMEPFPAQPGGPGVWIGSWGSAAGMRRVVRLGDGWLASGYNTDPDKFRSGLAALRAALDDAGRGSEAFPNGIATMWTYVTEDRARASRILENVLAPMLRRDVNELRDLLPIGPADHCASVLQAYSDAGAERIFIWPLQDERDQLEVFRRDVFEQIR
jgi:alkanesulfonate monooxygenase SsuD/methylene tetrahydromethanopterin reductase-like flavin-dependent oxidoreductase (luciferase family)